MTERTSHEIETLTATFNRLIKSLADARAETDAAYVGAIRALAVPAPVCRRPCRPRSISR